VLCSFLAATTAAVGGQGEDYARDIGVLGLRFRRGEVEVLVYEWGYGVRPVCECDLFAFGWACGVGNGS